MIKPRVTSFTITSELKLILAKSPNSSLISSAAAFARSLPTP
ncbi:hypothetical protein VB002_01300 [Campylobacter concisus]